MDAPTTAFVTGATGYIGQRVALALRDMGWRVTGLTRDAAKAEPLARLGIAPRIGRLQDPEGWIEAAASSDLLVHAAVDYAADAMALDRAAVEALALAGAARRATLIYTSGAWVHGATGDRVADEDAPLAPPALVAARPATEARVLGDPALRGIVVRPGLVYGRGGGITAGFARGAPVIGDGRNRWPLVHVDDLARLYALAAARGRAGAAYLAVDDQELAVAEVARAVRAAAGLAGDAPLQPLAEARATLGAFADALVLDQRLSSARARRELGWRPAHPGLRADAAAYATAQTRS